MTTADTATIENPLTQDMTLRDHFAALAMAQYLAEQRRDALEIEKGNSPYTASLEDSDIAQLSYDLADAMLRARREP
jgi:hypothetical protein